MDDVVEVEEEEEEVEEVEEMNQDQEIVAIPRKHKSHYCHSSTITTNEEAAIALLDLATIEAKRPVTTTPPLKKILSKFTLFFGTLQTPSPSRTVATSPLE